MVTSAPSLHFGLIWINSRKSSIQTYQINLSQSSKSLPCSKCLSSWLCTALMSILSSDISERVVGAHLALLDQYQSVSLLMSRQRLTETRVFHMVKPYLKLIVERSPRKSDYRNFSHSQAYQLKKMRMTR